MQLDRFLAIYCSIRYKNKVTTDRAVNTCSLSIIFSAIVAGGITIIDKKYAVCVLSLLITKPTYIVTVGIPNILAVRKTVACYIYAAIVDHQLSKVQ